VILPAAMKLSPQLGLDRRTFIALTACSLAHAAQFRRTGSTGTQFVLPRSFVIGDNASIEARAREAKDLVKRGHEVEQKVSETAAGQQGISITSGLKPLNSTGFGGIIGGARIFFLFLSYSGLENANLWHAFFSQAAPGQHRAFLHCKDYRLCEWQLRTSNLLGLNLVKTVPSEYCVDLVSPMVQLMQSALAESYSSMDKFVFLSETTLPVKPFSEVYSTLASTSNSDMCISPSKEWVWLVNEHAPTGQMATLVKHDQWVVLSRAHAQLMVQRWPHVRGQTYAHWNVPTWPNSHHPDYSLGDFGKLPGGINRCTDEWAIFGTLYGVVLSSRAQEPIPGLNAQALMLEKRHAEKGQGVCRTFVTWGKTAGNYDTRPVAQELRHLLSCYPDCLSTHPAEFKRMTLKGLLVLRNSPFLFARKFPANLIAYDEFAEVILAKAPPIPQDLWTRVR